MTMKQRQSMLIGRRLKAARERAGLTQQQLASKLGLQHRQSLASIEAGERKLSADELLLAVSVLNVDIDYFTDSFRLVGEGQFSFRASADVAECEVDEFEEKAGRWIAMYRELGAQQGSATQWLEHKLALTSRSSYEDAQQAAHALIERWRLGEAPAKSLSPAVEKHLGTLVLFVDAPTGISGAAWQVPGFNAILVNRREKEGRRNFDLAHELFHLLTWDRMEPPRVDPHEGNARSERVEQLADNFAAALLMPTSTVTARWQAREVSTDIHDWLRHTSAGFGVSGVALMWRLVNLGAISKDECDSIDKERLSANGHPVSPASGIPCFSKSFIERVAAALDAGRLSVKRAASLLSLSVADFATLLRDYGLEPSFEP